MSLNDQEIKNKIIELYPEIKKFGLEIKAEFSTDKNAWLVTLKKGEKTLYTHIESEDARRCVDGEKCVYFGNQLMGFIDAYCTGSSACSI
ncbi:hypothetical protein [Maridesulfovibrio bastinii]|jgi:alanyl-tRNA synthetase|uniref:hypothetical protein n=1 Tax=Maridesulfovibrio bastinii TaxID=47157 RepID=UPI00040968BD|nr:hypothetical protein [Maridesulfovibrio bastinii]